MTNLHSLQLQRSMFAWLATQFPSHTKEYSIAEYSCEATHWLIQERALQGLERWTCQAWAKNNRKVLRRLNTALIAMPQAAYEAADGGLSEVKG